MLSEGKTRQPLTEKLMNAFITPPLYPNKDNVHPVSQDHTDHIDPVRKDCKDENMDYQNIFHLRAKSLGDILFGGCENDN